MYESGKPALNRGDCGCCGEVAAEAVGCAVSEIPAAKSDVDMEQGIMEIAEGEARRRRARNHLGGQSTLSPDLLVASGKLNLKTGLAQ